MNGEEKMYSIIGVSACIALCLIMGMFASCERSDQDLKAKLAQQGCTSLGEGKFVCGDKK